MYLYLFSAAANLDHEDGLYFRDGGLESGRIPYVDDMVEQP